MEKLMYGGLFRYDNTNEPVGQYLSTLLDKKQQKQYIKLWNWIGTDVLSYLLATDFTSVKFDYGSKLASARFNKYREDRSSRYEVVITVEVYFDLEAKRADYIQSHFSIFKKLADEKERLTPDKYDLGAFEANMIGINEMTKVERGLRAAILLSRQTEKLMQDYERMNKKK